MASATDSNANANGNGSSQAELLMKQHDGRAPKKAQVEDAPDEDLQSQTPSTEPSSVLTSSEPSSTSAPEVTVSAKAAGKQPVRDQPTNAAHPKPVLDTQSEDAFPALGDPKAHSSAPAPSSWSKKPAAAGKPANGVSSGTVHSISKPSSGSSTPIPGTGTPQSTTLSQRGPVPQMNLPGRYREQIRLHPSDMTPRSQLKKPVSDTLRDINKKSKAHVEMKAGPGGVMVFEGTGPVDAVLDALKEVATQLCSKQNVQISVPASIRGQIVGKQGATIQAISKKSSARINISRQEAAEILDDDDLDRTVDISIEGDPFAVQMAKQEIEAIVDKHTSTTSTRLKHIPAEYYPFLAGPHNSRTSAFQEGRNLKMQIPLYQAYRQQPPPQAPANRQPAAFTAQASVPIQLSGDRQAIADARAELDRQVQELQRQLTLEQMAIERGRHQFIVGDMGTSLHDFLKETGCSVILPPASDDSEILSVVGPPDRIEEGINKIMDLAASMSMASADIARQHANAPRGAQVHARDVTRYLQQRQAIEELERMHSARIVPESTGAWSIYAKDGRNAMKARSDIMNLISGHPPTRFQQVGVDPFYHDHIRQSFASQIRDRHGVRVVVPQDDEPSVLLVFEDRAPSPEYQLPRKQPTAQDTQSFQEALQQAQRDILDLANGRKGIVSEDIEAPSKFHDKIRRHVDRHHSNLPANHIPLQVQFGNAGPSRPQQQTRSQIPNINVRGPQNDVQTLVESLLAFIEQERQDELERGFTLSFDFPQKFGNHLIGRKGENINRLREEFDVEIQLKDGNCEIKGPEAKANACKKHIVEMAKKLEDEATHHLNIPSQYHKDLIGPQGSQVNRLQDRYHVRVNFPKTRQVPGDDASEAGGEGRRPSQLPHEVIIKGPSRGADSCRDELLSLLQYVRDNSHSATVSVAQHQVPSLIGSGGREMEAMRLETGAQIDVPNARDTASSSGRAEIRLKGSKKAVEDAKKLIEEKAKVFDSTVSRTLEVDRKHHRLIIGGQGSNLRKIITEAGGPDDVKMHNRMIRFPRSDADGNSIRIEGQKPVVDKICSAIEAMVQDQDSQSTEIVEVRPDKHRLLIGHGGEIRRKLEKSFGVTINVPRQHETGPQRSQVRISGPADKVALAKAHIVEITKDGHSETIDVPRKLHHSVSDNGQFFRRLRAEHKVTVDHAGHTLPNKAAAPTPSRANGTAPLITDDPTGETDNHSFEIHELVSSAEEGTIPWNLSGPSLEAVEAARAKLEKAVTLAGEHDSMGFLILPDPRAYRIVIGPSGSNINAIRKQTGTRIQVPRDQNKGEAIEIVGSKNRVEEAKDAILEVVAGAGQ